MNLKEVTNQDIFNFIEGEVNLALSLIDLKSKSYDEQIKYRKSKCSDCAEQGKCMVCGCTYPDRLYSHNTCNSDRFPNIMGDEEWITYKKENGI